MNPSSARPAIRRRACPAPAALVLAALALLLVRADAAVLAAGAVVSPAGKPNIILIYSDDMYKNMFNFLPQGRSGGRALNLTPNLDRLAAEGVVLRGFHITSPVCTPSRYSCLTGRYAGRARNEGYVAQARRAGQGIITWNTHITPEDMTLAKLLKQAGYATGMVGKNHTIQTGAVPLPAAADPNVPDVRERLRENERRTVAGIQRAGFDFVASIYNGNPDDIGPQPFRVHNMEWLTAAGLTFLDQSRDRPFFLYFATTLVHGPTVPNRSWDADPRATPFGYLDTPPAVQPPRSSLPKRLADAGLAGQHRENILWLDDAIGTLLARLKELGLEDKTIIVFANDNGQEDKGSIYEGGASSAAFVWKTGGFPCGRDTPALLANIDLAPTILDLAGVPQPPAGTFDGQTFLPVLEGRAAQVRDELYLELGFTRGLRRGPWKYIALRYPPNPERFALAGAIMTSVPGRPPFGHIAGSDNEQKAIAHHPAYWDPDQLFDLASDPDEQNNLAGDPRHATTLEEMERRLRAHLAAMPGGFADLKPAESVGSGGNLRGAGVKSGTGSPEKKP
jgi:arylsulfatase A-like enzyme